MPDNQTTPTVSWGPTSSLGVGGSLVGALVVLLTVVFKMDNDQAVGVAGAVLAVGSFLVTLLGRYAQAKAAASPNPLIATVLPGDSIVAEVPEDLR